MGAEPTFAQLGVDVGDTFNYTIEGLTPGTTYNVKVSAANDRGYGKPCSPKSEMPRAVPDAPATTSLRRVHGSSTSLKVYWTKPPSDNGIVTTHYRVDWDTSEHFNSSAMTSQSDTFGAFRSTTLSDEIYEYTITKLVAGTTYYTRVVAQNERGYSLPRLSTPLKDYPRKAPDEIVYRGVKLLPVQPSSTTPVKTASSSLVVSWEGTQYGHGVNVTNILLSGGRRLGSK